MAEDTNSITLSDHSGPIVIGSDSIPFGAYQAIYHKLTKKVEKNSKHYSGAYTISFNDIENLHHRISQLLTQYNVKLNNCEISHVFKDDQHREHSSFEKFKFSDCTIRSCTKRVNYQYDFLILLPSQISGMDEIAQRYKLHILLDQEFIESDDLSVPYFIRGIVFGKNINVNIEYTDYAVYQSLISVIDGWISTLPKKDPSSLTKFLLKRESFFRNFSDIIVRFLGLIAGVVAFFNIDEISNPKSSSLILFFIAIAFTSYGIIGFLIDGFYKSISKINPATFILITDGDKDRMNDVISKRKKITSVIIFILSAFILTVAINIFSNYIYDYIFK